jgi:hypothetical protein
MQFLSPFLALVLTLAPVFAPPATGWVKLPPNPNHPAIASWELPGQAQQFMFSGVPFSGTTEDQRATFEAAFKSGSIPLQIESEGTVKLCNGLIADRLTVVSTRGLATHTEHVFIAYSGKLYDLSYVYVTPLPEAQAVLATLCPATP